MPVSVTGITLYNRLTNSSVLVESPSLKQIFVPKMIYDIIYFLNNYSNEYTIFNDYR